MLEEGVLELVPLGVAGQLVLRNAKLCESFCIAGALLMINYT